MNSHSKLKDLLTLANTEEQEQAECEQKAAQLNQAFLDGHSDQYADEENKFTDKIQAFPAEKVLKYAEAGDEFRNYCERKSLWTSFLKRRGYHGENLPALDEEEPECTNVNQYIGQFLFGQWEESREDLELLNKACEQNIFPALKARCQLNLTNLKNNKDHLSAAEINAAENKIVKDLATINNHYWAPGHIYSYTAFMELAIIHHINQPNEEDAPEEQRKTYFLECALESELTAALLFKHPVSTAIFKAHGIDEWVNNEVASLPQAEQRLLDILAINKTDKLYKDTLEKVEEKYKAFKM